MQRELPSPTAHLSAYVGMLKQKVDDPMYLCSKPFAKARNFQFRAKACLKQFQFRFRMELQLH